MRTMFSKPPFTYSLGVPERWTESVFSLKKREQMYPT